MISDDLKKLAAEVARLLAADRNQSELITEAEAAALVRGSVSTIRKWRKTGLIKRYGKGRLVRVSRAEVMRADESSKGSSVEARVRAAQEKKGTR